MQNFRTPFSDTQFSNKRIPILHVTFQLERPDGSIFTDNCDMWVDSGNDGDLKLPDSFSSRLNNMGIKGVQVQSNVASGSSFAMSYIAQITEIRIGDTIIPINGPIDCDITCMGPDTSAPLIGLEALKRWEICLDLPKQILSIH